ncbi:MAG: NAD(P)H-dependent oxidoreductase [Oscillospiraceae bacterium]|nr:NAD(P)H-dependent oxidoreductase [Oscillospiraceae bacterium]
MDILVINGSPKGKNSITLQTVNYLQLRHPEHHFEVLHAGQRIKALEKDFSPALEAVKKADVLLFSYPVYTFVVPCQLHRFVELLKASGLDLSGKYASQISTSKHFYDMTAHRFIQDNCADLGLRYIPSLSADMDDLTTKKGQKEADDFFRYLCWSVEQGIYEPIPEPLPAPAKLPVTVPAAPAWEKSGDVVIIADLEEDDEQLRDMINRFRAVLPRKTRMVNIRKYPFRGGCLGCFNCAVSGKCIYTDGFDDYLRNKIQTADSIVYAFTIRDHSMGSRFKMYDDRQFCNGHRTVTIGMPVGYLISGNYSRETNLQTIVEARAQVGSNFLAGVATDEQNSDTAIDQLCAKLTYALEHKYLPPQNFYGIGGMKVFRDLIWLMQGMMKADHKFYKSHGQYDFPQKQWPRMVAMYAVGAMLGNPKLKAKMGSAMTDGMLMPYNKVLEQVKKEQKK